MELGGAAQGDGAQRAARVIVVETSLDGTSWSQIRMAHLVEDGPGAVAYAGLYACSPKGTGYVARFHFLRLEPGRHTPSGSVTRPTP